jgi:hypothetical protein
MKKLIQILLLILVCNGSFAQHTSPEAAEDKIVVYLKKMSHYRHKKNRSDSVYAINKRLLQFMFDIGFEGYILSYDFKKLEAAGIEIHTSDDGMVRTFSWEVISIGPMHYYNYMKSYYQDAKRSMSFTNTSGASLTDIYTIKVDDYKTYYLIREENKYDVKNRYCRLVSHTLHDGYLIISPYFYNNTDSQSFAGYTYDLASFSAPEKKLPPVRLSADKKELIVPVINEGGVYSDVDMIYTWHPNGFVYNRYTKK